MKKKIFAVGISLLMCGVAYSQVGINTKQPQATLDVNANTGNDAIEGIIAPRLTRAQIISKIDKYDTDQTGAIVYITDLSGTATDDRVKKITSVGYYYFDGNEWDAFTLVDNTWVKDATGHLIKLGVQSNSTSTRTVGTDLAITDEGSIGIGTTTPSSSAILDLTSTNKGFLAPRVALTSTTDQTTIPTPAPGLLVYNLGTAGLAFKGYVYWDGSRWLSFNSASLTPGTIGAITCNGVTATPSTYETGKEYTGTMMIPYTGGDGGMYPAMTLGPVNGLTATLEAGNFNIGAGTLAFTIKGTPTVTTPTVTTFAVNIGGKTCSASIGAGSGIAPGDLVFYEGSFLASIVADTKVPGSDLMSYYVKDLPVIGGKLRLDVKILGASNRGPDGVTINPVLFNITDKPVKLWFSAMTTVNNYNAGNYVLAANNYVNLDDGIYYDFGLNDMIGSDGLVYNAANGTTLIDKGAGRSILGAAGNHQEVVTVDVSLDGKWYRIYYFPIVDNLNNSNEKDDLRKIYLSIQRLY